MVEDIINIHINVINNLYNITNIKYIINQIIKTMSKQLFKVSNLPNFLFRDKMGVIINSSQGYPQVFNHIIIPSDSDSTEIIKIDAIGHIREHHVFLDKIYETSSALTATIQAAVKRAFVEPVKEIKVEKKKSMFDKLTDIEKNLISEYRAGKFKVPDMRQEREFVSDCLRHHPINELYREDLPMRVIVITSNPEQIINDWPTFGPRILDPEEQEKGVYEND